MINAGVIVFFFSGKKTTDKRKGYMYISMANVDSFEPKKLP